MKTIINEKKLPVCIFNGELDVCLNYPAICDADTVTHIIITPAAMSFIFADFSISTYWKSSSDGWRAGFDRKMLTFEEV